MMRKLILHDDDHVFLQSVLELYRQRMMLSASDKEQSYTLQRISRLAADRACRFIERVRTAEEVKS